LIDVKYNQYQTQGGMYTPPIAIWYGRTSRQVNRLITRGLLENDTQHYCPGILEKLLTILKDKYLFEI
jgi:hypothetical protein